MIRVVIQERPPAPSDLVRVTRFPIGFLPAGALFTPLLVDFALASLLAGVPLLPRSAPIGDLTRHGGRDQPRAGYLLPAHRESLHRG